MEREIRKAYDMISPGENERAAMLRIILSAASFAPPERKNMKKKTLSSALLAAAVAALLLGLGVTAYAQGWFGLDNLAASSRTIEFVPQEEIAARNKALEEAVARGEDPADVLAELDERDFQRLSKSFRIVSLQGPADSPEAMACIEYQDFLESYDTDKAILHSIGNGPSGFEEDYGPYTCYSQEMADKIDEICEKYSLQKLSGMRIPQSLHQFFYLAGTDNFAPKQDRQTGQNLMPERVWADGSFKAVGTVTRGCYANYSISRCVKGSFITTVAGLNDPEAWTEWHYTAENGAELLLAQGEGRAMVFADRPESFVVISLHDAGKLSSDPAKLEAFVELFDFTAIP